MSYVDAYVKCDICGKDMKLDDTDKYKIMPRKTAWIRRYIFSKPLAGFWSEELDICSDCWEEMKEYIKKKIQ